MVHKTPEDVRNGKKKPRTIMQGLRFYTHGGRRVDENYSDEWSVQEWAVDGADEVDTTNTL